jgi:arsenate reductase
MKKVLFVCIHNSARSQMAEALLNKYGQGEFDAFSAGLEPAPLNPLAVEALREEDIDISANASDSVFELFQQGKIYNYVITVCDEASGQRCPLFPGLSERISWSFEDPGTFEGSHEQKLQQTKAVKDAIKEKVLNFIDEVKKGSV